MSRKAAIAATEPTSLARGTPGTPGTLGQRIARWTLWPLALGVGALALLGGAQDFGSGYGLDLFEYQCYAAAFWHGRAGVQALPAGQCDLMLTVAGSHLAAQPFHTLPLEYGVLALAVFSPPLLAPAGWYPWLFTGGMALALVATAYCCAWWGPWLAGHAYLVYVLLGSFIIAGTRFDAVPALLTVLAVVWAAQRRSWQAYAALAAATLLKIYPVALLLPFLVADLRAARGTGERGSARVPSRFGAMWWLRGLGVYVAVVGAGLGLALLLSPRQALGPLSFLASRGVEFESLPASLLLLGHLVAGVPLDTGYEANVTIAVSPWAGGAAVAGAALGVALVASSAWLQWRGRLPLIQACLITLLGVLVGSKVFSPQYLLWVTPLVALAYGVDVVWVVLWGAVCLLTMLTFPVAYDGGLTWTGAPSSLTVVWVSALRNVALVLAAVWGLWQAGVGSGAHRFPIPALKRRGTPTLRGVSRP